MKNKFKSIFLLLGGLFLLVFSTGVTTNTVTPGKCEYYPFTTLVHNSLDEFKILQSVGYKYNYGTWVKTNETKSSFPREIKVFGNHLEMYITKDSFPDFLTSLYLKGYQKTEFGYQCDCSYFMSVTDYGRDFKLGFYETKCDVKKKPKPQLKKVYVCDGPYATKFHSTASCRGLSNCSGQILYFNDINEAIEQEFAYCGICWN